MNDDNEPSMLDTLKSIGQLAEASKKSLNSGGRRITLKETVKTNKGREITVITQGNNPETVMGDLNLTVSEVKEKL